MKSRFTMPLLFALVLCSGSLQAQDTLVVSERVGKVIDKYERWYYQIFPRVGVFESAVLINDSMGVAAHVQGANDVVIPISPGYVRLFKQYLEIYDSVYYALHSEKDQVLVHNRYLRARNTYHWLVEGGLAAEILEFGANEMILTVHSPADSTAGKLTCIVLWADEKGLLLHSIENDQSDTLYVPAQSLVSVAIQRRAGTGAMVAGGIIGGLISGTIGYLAASEYTACHNYGCDRASPGVITFVTALMAFSGAATGVFIGALFPTEDHTQIKTPEAYRNYLPILQSQMYYRHGLPPDSPWREK